MSSLRCLLHILGVLYFINKGYCLQCYECASKDESEERYCIDPFGTAYADDNYQSECGDKMTHCVKYKTISYLRDSGFISGASRNTITMSRMCIKRPDRGNGCRIIEGASSFYIECLCDTDFCNGGHTVLPNLLSFVLALALAVLYIR